MAKYSRSEGGRGGRMKEIKGHLVPPRTKTLLLRIPDQTLVPEHQCSMILFLLTLNELNALWRHIVCSHAAHRWKHVVQRNIWKWVAARWLAHIVWNLPRSSCERCQKVKVQTVNLQRHCVKVFVTDLARSYVKVGARLGRVSSASAHWAKNDPYSPRKRPVSWIPIGCVICKHPRYWRNGMLIPPTSV